jgi:hypothetical protein
MASTKSKKSRKGLAVALAVLGVAGLSLASASQLTFGTAPQLQAGVQDIAGCQTSTITVAFTTPALAGGEYKSTNATLTSFDATCAGSTYKVALLKSDGSLAQTESTGTVAAGVLTVPLSGATPATVSRVAVTIYKP